MIFNEVNLSYIKMIQMECHILIYKIFKQIIEIVDKTIKSNKNV